MVVGGGWGEGGRKRRREQRASSQEAMVYYTLRSADNVHHGPLSGRVHLLYLQQLGSVTPGCVLLMCRTAIQALLTCTQRRTARTSQWSSTNTIITESKDDLFEHFFKLRLATSHF